MAFFAQQRLRTCAVASLRSVLASQFGVHVREDVLRFSGDNAKEPITREGSNTDAIRRMVRAADAALNTGARWRLRVTKHGTIKDLARELRAGRLPLVSVPRGSVVHHMLVVSQYKPGFIRYFDPATGKLRWSTSGEFRRQWLDRENGGITWYAVVVGYVS